MEKTISRNWQPTVSRIFVGVSAGGALLGLGGCSNQADPGFNPYGPYNGQASVLEAAEAGLLNVENGLDNLDHRIENAVY